MHKVCQQQFGLNSLLLEESNYPKEKEQHLRRIHSIRFAVVVSSCQTISSGALVPLICTSMALTLYALFKAALLVLNALAVLHPHRFLKTCMKTLCWWSCPLEPPAKCMQVLGSCSICLAHRVLCRRFGQGPRWRRCSAANSRRATRRPFHAMYVGARVYVPFPFSCRSAVLTGKMHTSCVVVVVVCIAGPLIAANILIVLIELVFG